MDFKAKKTDETTPQPSGAAINDSTEASSRCPAPLSKSDAAASALEAQGTGQSVNPITDTVSSQTRNRSSTILESITAATAGLRNLLLGPRVEGYPPGVVLVKTKVDPLPALASAEVVQFTGQEPVVNGKSTPNNAAEGKISGMEQREDDDVIIASVSRKSAHGKEPAHPSPSTVSTSITHPVAQPPSSSSKPQPQRPSAPPSLSSIAHSLATTSTTTPRQQYDTSAGSSGENDGSTSTSPTSTNAMTEGRETVAETQEAALAAISAVIHSTGQHYTAPLTTRAALLHQNNTSLREQEYHLLKSTELLRRDGDTAMRLFKESNDKLKSLGDLGNWSKLIENELDVLQETYRIVEHGTVELDKCYTCGEDIPEYSSDEEDAEDTKGKGKARQKIALGREGRWCGDCGRAWHLACAREAGGDAEENQDEAPEAHEPDDSVYGHSAPTQRYRSSNTDEGGRAPKPSSMFEWGGWAGGDTDAAGSYGSETSTINQGEGWRCWECNLKYDLEGIVDSLGEEEYDAREDGMGESSFDDIDALLNEGLGAPRAVPKG